MTPYPMLAGAGFVAGFMNAVAGGGSFVSFPALLYAGVPSVAANASSTVALFPGALTSTWAVRDRLQSFGPVPLKALLGVSLVGGLIGAILLLVTPDHLFDVIIPWLLLLATIVFTFGRRVGEALQARGAISPAVLMSTQFVLAIYGGYFGGAVGLMMLAAWTLLGATDAKAMTPARTFLTGATNSIAVICFALAGKVEWPQTLIMLVAAAAGGYAGALAVQRFLNPAAMRAVVIVFMIVITTVFFVRAF